MKVIQQESSYSCGIAAIQMVTALSKTTIHALLGYAPDDINPVNKLPFGMSEIETVALLHLVGYSPSIIVTKEHLLNIACTDSLKARLQLSLCIPTMNELTHLLYNNVAVLCTTNHHMLVWDRDVIIDPALSTAQGRSIQEYDICSAIFVRDPENKRALLH